MAERSIHRVINLVPDETQVLCNMTVDQARRLLFSDDVGDVLRIRGSFALVAQEGEPVCMAPASSTVCFDTFWPKNRVDPCWS